MSTRPSRCSSSGKWILVDATHDPALAALGLAVGHWDGASATDPAYQALGSILPHGHDGLLRDLDEAIERIGEQVEATRSGADRAVSA